MPTVRYGALDHPSVELTNGARTARVPSECPSCHSGSLQVMPASGGVVGYVCGKCKHVTTVTHSAVRSAAL